jgi:hypothetical protein
MLKYLSKFAMDILPSVAATIIGAYIVNHYIAARPAADAPVAAAASAADPSKADGKRDAKLSRATVDVGNIPGPGVTAKGVSERAMLEKTAAEKPAVVEQPAEKAADKAAETASIPAEPRRHPPAPREKTVARTAPVQQPTPVAAAPMAASPVEAAVAPEEHHDANDLARAAIERLRGSADGSRAQEATRAPDPPRLASAPPVTSPVASVPAVRPLPPPIMVSTPAAGTFDSATGSLPAGPSSPAAAGSDDPGRPTPPADIPQASPPLDLRAEAAAPPRRQHTTVAEDVLLAAKSVFHAVLPK